MILASPATIALVVGVKLVLPCRVDTRSKPDHTLIAGDNHRSGLSHVTFQVYMRGIRVQCEQKGKILVFERASRLDLQVDSDRPTIQKILNLWLCSPFLVSFQSLL